MKSLIVYQAGGSWFGQEVSWKRSGSGFYREIAGIGVPQTRAEIEKFARENGFAVEWRADYTAPNPAAASPAAKPGA